MARAGVLSIIVLLMASALCAQQIGGGTCSNSTINGSYFWQIAGVLATTTGGTVPLHELAGIVTDGKGSFSGEALTVLNGALSNDSLAGTYSVQSDCTGTFTIFVNSQLGGQATFQIVSGGQTALIAWSTSTKILTGTIHRRSADVTASCGNGSLSGSYGYLLTGFAANTVFTDDGNISSDGKGNLTARSTVNLSGAVSSAVATGTYSVTSDCSGLAKLTDQNRNTANYALAVVEDGNGVLFLRTDPATTVSGLAVAQFTAPQQAVVNGASFAPRRLAPGSLFSIFGNGFSQQTASATSLPLPTSLASTQVLMNGQPVPLDYVSPSQINAQVPLETPVSTPVAISVVNAGKQSNTTTLNTLPAAPGIFTYGQNQAVVQNRDLSVNSPTNPAHTGDVVVAYLTGGGAVSASGSWVTGGASPGGLSPVTSSYSVTVGGQQAQGMYLGLTPGFVGLYQANIKVPQIAPGNYPLSITVNGVLSNGPLISVAN